MSANASLVVQKFDSTDAAAAGEAGAPQTGDAAAAADEAAGDAAGAPEGSPQKEVVFAPLRDAEEESAPPMSAGSFSKLLEHRVFSGTGVSNRSQARLLKVNAKTKSLHDLRKEMHQVQETINNCHPLDKRAYAPLPKPILVTKENRALRQNFFQQNSSTLLSRADGGLAQLRNVAASILENPGGVHGGVKPKNKKSLRSRSLL